MRMCTLEFKAVGKVFLSDFHHAVMSGSGWLEPLSLGALLPHSILSQLLSISSLFA